MKQLRERDAHAALMAYVQRNGTQTAAAQGLGITKAYMHDLIRGRRDISDRILSKLGLRRIVVDAAA